MKNWSFDILRLLQRSSAGGRLATPRSPCNGVPLENEGRLKVRECPQFPRCSGIQVWVSRFNSGQWLDIWRSGERWKMLRFLPCLILSPFQFWPMPTSRIWRQTQLERWSPRYIPNILVVPKVLSPFALSLYSFVNFTLRVQSIRMFGDLDSQYIGSNMATKVACLSCLSTHICHFPP
jgi:hypothetical protein